MDQLAGRDTPEAEQAYQTMMQAAGIAPVGMIAWHGSPHKFDKFSLDKIGTGEGAQAYGNGLYVAESPEVAQNYADFVKRITPLDLKDAKSRLLKMETDNWKRYKPSDIETQRRIVADYEKRLADKSVYKVDIPDEAVARFLDWDKPLSQQAPEVQGVLKSLVPDAAEHWVGQILHGQVADAAAKANGSGLRGSLNPEGPETARKLLSAAGIPGIRYLDGGSRGTGTGTSNFVAFDPELIRILERNGQPTGLQPWKPGEWKR
jgi:hypothetical protein